MYYQFPVFFNILTDANLVNIMRLQQGMILLGGDQLFPIPLNDTNEARQCFRLYQKELMDMKIPIRYMTHATLHILDDVDHFGVGVERLS